MNDAVMQAVQVAIETVLRDTGRAGSHPEQGHRLADDLGLDSLDIAQTIVLLERSLGVDPFRSAERVRSPVHTVADLAAIYAEALRGSRE